MDLRRLTSWSARHIGIESRAVVLPHAPKCAVVAAHAAAFSHARHRRSCAPEGFGGCHDVSFAHVGSGVKGWGVLQDISERRARLGPWNRRPTVNPRERLAAQNRETPSERLPTGGTPWSRSLSSCS